MKNSFHTLQDILITGIMVAVSASLLAANGFCAYQVYKKYTLPPSGTVVCNEAGWYTFVDINRRSLWPLPYQSREEAVGMRDWLIAAEGARKEASISGLQKLRTDIFNTSNWKECK